MNINNEQVTEHGCEANKNGHSHFHTNFNSGMNRRWWRCYTLSGPFPHSEELVTGKKSSANRRFSSFKTFLKKLTCDGGNSLMVMDDNETA